MRPSSLRSRREAEAWAAVAEVMDPELDEPVTEMGVVERIEVGGDGAIALDFRLPTYWCSPNFAFLMLDGMRAALERLSWRPRFRITLHDHLFADQVNAGLAAGKPFGEIFDELAPGEDLDALRQKFQMKAFQRRQEAALAELRAAVWPQREILALNRADLDAPPPGFELVFTRYAQALQARFPGSQAESPAFVDWDGKAIAPESFDDYLARLRAVRINMEFNGALCRGLKQVRYRERAASSSDLTLIDFIRQPVANQGTLAGA